MDWIEVSARTLEDARELALDRLGVVDEELEYEVIDEPKGGIFGIGRTEARIRARVRPISREKPADRRRRRSSERRPSSGGRKPRGDSAAARWRGQRRVTRREVGGPRSCRAARRLAAVVIVPASPPGTERWWRGRRGDSGQREGPEAEQR